MHPLPSTIRAEQPPTALAPMQDVTTLPFMQLLHQYGDPDWYFTEFFRVHECSTPEKHILASITDHGTGRPVFAQLIGEQEVHLKRTVKALRELPIAGIDLNMGCPAPKIYKKNVGGGLLRNPEEVERVLACLREAVEGRFTVKMRIGFEDTRHFAAVLDLINQYEIDLLSLHGRTVTEMYRSEVHYDAIAEAVQALRCPVLANGNISSAQKAAEVREQTGCHGLMIGRSAIRNPWIFRQCREHFAGEPVFAPTLADVFGYCEALRTATFVEGITPRKHVSRMKKFLNFVALGVDADGAFLHDLRRAADPDDMLRICETYLLGAHASETFALEAHEGLVARPNCE